MQVNPDIRKEKWSAEEDRQLAALVAEHGNRWADIAKKYDSAHKYEHALRDVCYSFESGVATLIFCGAWPR
jgi:transposase-like protein